MRAPPGAPADLARAGSGRRGDFSRPQRFRSRRRSGPRRRGAVSASARSLVPSPVGAPALFRPPRPPSCRNSPRRAPPALPDRRFERHNCPARAACPGSWRERTRIDPGGHPLRRVTPSAIRQSIPAARPTLLNPENVRKNARKTHAFLGVRLKAAGHFPGISGERRIPSRRPVCNYFGEAPAASRAGPICPKTHH